VEGWHDTGDIVALDDAGFVSIKGRAKRFAKIGGEMVSLPAVEGWPAMLAGPCPCRCHPPRSQEGRGAGAVHQLPAADPRDLLQWGRGHGVTELMIPRDIRVLAELPVLGTGKLDYVTMGQMAQLPSAVSQEEDDEDALIQA
jgi:acyl-[acyl-carrier-protein]-phospholipid O-acyltransferase/long-chain-fatty-acid--[acyl-carrier-protein] ligase